MRPSLRRSSSLLCLSACLIFASCSAPGGDDDAATGTPVDTPDESPAPTATPSSTPTPTAGPTDTPLDTPIDTPVDTPTATPVITPTEPPVGSPTPTPGPDDRDHDGIEDDLDNCPDLANANQEDFDGDDIGDVCDNDRDGDGILNPNDDFPDDPDEWLDSDGDGVGDNADEFPADHSESVDSDDDGVGDNADNCPQTANEGQEDLDQDGDGDACDEDRDGDDVPDAQDAFPDNPVEWQDSDGDGVGDNSDAFPNDPTQSGDSDGDGTGDTLDNCVAVPNQDQADQDADGAGDACDDDDDGDGFSDDDDAFPLDPEEWSDADGDGTGDNNDPFPDDPDESQDTDADGIGDNADNCASIANAGQADLDGDGAGDACDSDADGDGYTSSAVSGGKDCNDLDASVRPDAAEVCDGIDNNCSGAIDEGTKSTFYRDADGDSYGNPAVSTQACSAASGYVADKTDCDDASASIYPGATEVVGDGIDQSCNGSETCYTDLDGDGYRPSSGATVASQDADCVDPGEASSSVPTGDCKDANDAIYPGALELCNGIDDDCDGTVDDGAKTTFYRDADGDAYGTSADTVQACTAPSGYVAIAGDCNDANRSINPVATELCDAQNVDEDCDGTADDADSSTASAGKVRYYADQDQDTYGDSQDSGIDRCDDPSTSSAHYVTNHQDCDDTRSAVNPAAQEVCDSSNLDEDCDGKAEDADSSASSATKTRYYTDGDTDGYGANNDPGTLYCDDPSGSSAKWSTNNQDCDDTKASVSPAGSESLNSVDDDCDGLVDEGFILASCYALKQSDPSLASGYYTIDVDGPTGSKASFKVFCDMTTSGGGWTRIYYQSTADGTFFKSTDFELNKADPTATKYAILNDLESFRRNGGFEFRMDWPNSVWTQNQIWSQTNNPATDAPGTMPTGYKAISAPYSSNGWGGLQRSAITTYSILDGTLNPLNNWYYAVGTTYAWNAVPNSQPAPDGGVAIAELWVR